MAGVFSNLGIPAILGRRGSEGKDPAVQSSTVPVAILIKDKQGEETSSFAAIVRRSTSQNILRGSLLVPIPVEKQIQRNDGILAPNYQTMLKDRTVTLFCGPNDVVPLNEYEYNLLCGIKSIEARYQTFILPDVLDWGSKWVSGNAICVSITGSHAAEPVTPKKVSAVLRYVGPVDGLSGITFGVEITDSHYFGNGTTNGEFRGKQYFTCPEDNGLFVSLDRLSEHPAGPQIETTATTAAAATAPPPTERQLYPPRPVQRDGRRKQKAPSKAEVGSISPPSRKEGDRVVVFKKDGKPVSGTVRWVGPYTHQAGKKWFSFNAVGIETDVKVFSTEMESVLPRRSHVLTVGKDKGQIFISEEEVILEADFLGQETPPETPQSLEQQNLSKQVEELQRANQELHREKKELRRENQAFCRENQELKSQRKEIEQLQGLDQQRIHKLEQEVEEKARDMEERKQEVEEKKREVGHLQQELQREQERSARLQERLDQSTAELEQMKPTTALLNSVQFNTASRSEVQVQGNIGEGAWGVVARGQFNGQAVAIKWPHVALLKQYPNTVGRMRREVQIMSQVRHPNLVRFIAAVLDEAAEQLRASPMIITELLDTNLRIAYQEGRLQEAHCTPILCDVAFALHYLHDHLPPIIHRDVSTPNILLQALPNRGWLAKVSDFGSANLAKLARTAGEGAIVYTAPEAFPHMDEDTEPPEMTTKMDVFSYGVLMCEVLSREPPFSHNYLRNMLQQLQHRPEHGLVSRCTRRSPGDRPSMAGVLDELYKLPRPLPTPS